MPTEQKLYLIADQLRVIANLGLEFGKTEYDLERYQKILTLSAELVALAEERPLANVLTEYYENLAHLSPLLGCAGAVFRDGKLLLIQRTDNQRWTVPGGLVDVGETLAEATERELWEEAGVRGTATRLLGVFDSRRWGTKSKHHLYHLIWECEIGEQQPQPGSEALAVGFFGEDELPPLLHYGHEMRIPILFKLMRGEFTAPYYDHTETK